MFFQRPRPGFSALTAARIASRSASGSVSQRAFRSASRALCASASSRALRRALRSASSASFLASSALASALANSLGGLVVGPDRGDEVAGRVLADPLVLVLDQPVEDLQLGPDPARRVRLRPARRPSLAVTPRAVSASTSAEASAGGGGRLGSRPCGPRIRMIRHGPAPLPRVPLLGVEGLQEPELLQLLQRGLEPPLQLGRRVRPAHADVLAGQRPQVEVEPVAAVEPLVQEPEHPLGRRQPELEVELQVELLEVAALEAPEDHLVPAEAGEGQGVALVPAFAAAGRAGLARLAACAPAVAARGRRGSRCPGRGSSRRPSSWPRCPTRRSRTSGPRRPSGAAPPRSAGSSARSAASPAARSARTARTGPSASVKLLRRLVSWIRPTSTSSSIEVGRPCLCGPHDRQPADDRRAVATLQPVLEDQRRLAVRHPVRQRRDRELGQVQLVLPSDDRSPAHSLHSAQILQISSIVILAFIRIILLQSVAD